MKNRTVFTKNKKQAFTTNSFSLQSKQPKHKLHMKKKGNITLATLLLILCACQNNNEAKDAAIAPVKVKTIQVKTSVTYEEKQFSGTVEESNESALSFSVMGTVQSVCIKPGDHVKAGQLIASLDQTTISNNYQAAKATLNQAEDAYRRMKELYEKGSLPEIQWIETESKLQQAKSMEEIALKNLKDCQLYAPYDGVIAEKSIEVGQNVAPGIPIAKLIAVNELKVKISVPETEISSISTQQKATIKIPALNNQSFNGIVTEKGIAANPLSRSYDVKIKITDKNKELMPGMVAEVMLQTSKDEKPLYIIPYHIVQLDEHNNSFVWINNHGKAQKRNIICGEFVSNGVIVLSGLNENDEIIIEGQQKVCENTNLSL